MIIHPSSLLPYASKTCSEPEPSSLPQRRGPYSWNMELYEYPDDSGYEGRFTKCGICVLMKKLGLYDLTPALCRLDYTMSEAGGVTDFVRQYTLASGGPYCDCGYKKKGFVKAGTEAGR